MSRDSGISGAEPPAEGSRPDDAAPSAPSRADTEPGLPPPSVPEPPVRHSTAASSPFTQTQPGLGRSRRADTEVSDPGRRAATVDPYSVRGVRSPLVGRDDELARLRAAVQQAIDFQVPQLITIVGNQGTGKSRLIDELLPTLPLEVRTYLCYASENDGRYAAVSRLLRDRFDLVDAPDEKSARATLHRQVQEVFGDQRVGEVMHFLGQFVDLRFPDSPFLRVLGESPEQHDEIARTVLRRFIEVDAEQSPLLLVFDDGHWIDEASLSFLREIGTTLGGSPVVIVVAARPELTVRFSNWGEEVTDHVRVELRNLEVDEASEMFRLLLERCQTIPQEIVDDAVEMTGGNPYFLEQLVRLFLANGTIDPDVTPWVLDAARAAETELPISIEEAIEARIAALAAPERDLLEKGALFGNVFWVGALVALTRLEEARSAGDAPLPSPAGPLDYDWTDTGDAIRRRVIATIDDLVERDYLLRLDAEDSTITGDIEVVFKHNLERDLIAKGTDKRRLEQHHRMAAQWLELKISSRSDEQLEFLAQLYQRGGDTRRAAHCFVAGGNKAGERYAHEQAIGLYQRGLAILDEGDPALLLEALHNLGSALDVLGRTSEAQVQFTRMLRKAWLLDHCSKGGAAHSRLGRIHRRLGEYDAAMAHLRTAQSLFSQAQDQRGVASTLDDIGQIHWVRGAYGQALEFHRQGLAIRRALGDQRSIALCLANIGRVHRDSGAFKAANRQFREALELRRTIGDKSGVVESLCDLAGLHADEGQRELALEMYREARHTADEIGDRLALTLVLAGLGSTTAAQGDSSQALEILLEGISVATSLGFRVGRAECGMRLAEVYLSMGDAVQAYDQALRALEIARAIGSRAQIGVAHRVLAEAISHASTGESESARAAEHFHKAIEIFVGMKHEMELARCYRALSEFHQRTGDRVEAEKLSRRAGEIFERMRGAAE